MVRIILILSLFVSFSVNADFLGFKTGSGVKSKIPDLTARLKKLEMERDPVYEDNFNQLVKSIETSLEEEKLVCSGEAADPSGKVLEKGQKQLCFRELKGYYLEATEVIFDLKKKYLGLIHNRQIEKLSDIQKKIKADIEKSF